MKETLDREALHRRFAEALRAYPETRRSEFVFEIDRKEEGADGCNWYPLASMGRWKGDLRTNLRVWAEVRARLAAEVRLAE